MKVLLRERQEGQSQRKPCDNGSRDNQEDVMTLCYKDGERSHEPRHLETRKGKETDSFLELPEGTNPDDTLTLA